MHTLSWLIYSRKTGLSFRIVKVQKNNTLEKEYDIIMYTIALSAIHILTMLRERDCKKPSQSVYLEL